MDFLQNHIEALIFCSPGPIKVADIKACLSEMFNADVPEEDISGAIQRLEEKKISNIFYNDLPFPKLALQNMFLRAY